MITFVSPSRLQQNLLTREIVYFIVELRKNVIHIQILWLMADEFAAQKSAILSPLRQYLGNSWHSWLQTGSIRTMSRTLSGLRYPGTVKSNFWEKKLLIAEDFDYQKLN